MKRGRIFSLTIAAVSFFAATCRNSNNDTGMASRISTNSKIDSIQLETLLKPSDAFVLASLPVVAVRNKKNAPPISAYGSVEYDTRYAGSVSARVAGRIEKLYIRYRYQRVDAGQKIMDIYSPEIVTAEQNLLFLLRSDAGNTSLIDASKDRLLLLGMNENQLRVVIRNKKPLYSIGVYSNYEGHVHDAGMQGIQANDDTKSNTEPLTGELPLKEGMYVQKGQTLMMIMNHHKAWVALQIFPGDLSLVKKGSTVHITPETDTSALIDGQIDFIEPFLRPGAKTLTVRVYFHNGSMLPIGSHVTATINTDPVNSLWLPQTAVTSLGIKNVVFEKTPQGFMAHEVVVGLHKGEEIQIISGLNEEDSVIENAAYLVDRDSFIKTSLK